MWPQRVAADGDGDAGGDTPTGLRFRIAMYSIAALYIMISLTSAVQGLRATCRSITLTRRWTHQIAVLGMLTLAAAGAMRWQQKRAATRCVDRTIA